tara:strand:+ start:109 stop:429 length:321 start_codon:yes stop_codon:yes gene_type:complete
MNSFQIITLGIATLLAISVFWDKIRDAISNLKPEPKPYTPTPVDDQLVEVSVDYKTSKDSTLVDIIRCWEHLKVGCDKANLKEACNELDKIFPLFVMKDAKGVKNV